ncbi:cytochrome c [soil metagenome]
MRYFLLIFAALLVVIVVVAGLRGHRFTRPPLEVFSDMDRQPKVKAQVASRFFADGRAARPPVPGTVPMGYKMPVGQELPPQVSAYFETGRMGDRWGTGFPLEVTPDLMRRGQERFNITCAVCHGATGSGNGMAFKFGLVTVQSLNQPRLREMADGEIFNTITHGKNTMMGLGDRIAIPDRWAIIAYLRALQKSQGGASLRDVPPDELTKLQAP